MADEPENPAPDSADDTPPAPDTSSDDANETPADDSPPALDDAAEVTPAADEPAPSPDGPVAIGQGKLSEKDDKTFGMLGHLLGVITSFIGPLVIWLVKKEESPFVDDQGKEALNFQITMAIGYIVSSFLMSVGIGCLLYPAVLCISVVFGIIATVKANEGVAYRYPVTIRMIK